MVNEKTINLVVPSNDKSFRVDKENLYYKGVKITPIINDKNQKIYKDISVINATQYNEDNQKSKVCPLQIPKDTYFLNVAFHDSKPCIANIADAIQELFIEKINKGEKIPNFSFYYDDDCEFYNSELLEKFFKLNGIKIEQEKSNFLLDSIKDWQENNIKI